MWLITSDLHLSDRPKDGYRFGIFRWLAKQQEKYSPEATFLLGDLTQDKDNHSSALVNRTIDELTLLQPPVYILRGNHDGLDHNNPFFRFLNCIEGIHFIVEPEVVLHKIAMIPHCRTQEQFNDACKGMVNRAPKAPLMLHQTIALMLHQTIAGAIAETGRPLNGFSASPIELLKPLRCYSGDVHKPQRCGPVTYVGSPYQIRFGDQYIPRVLLVKNDREQDLHFPCPRKLSLTINDHTDLKNFNLEPNDQVKLKIILPAEEATQWGIHKQRIITECENLKVEVFGIDVEIAKLKMAADSKTTKSFLPKEILHDFCHREKVPKDVAEAGIELLKG